jgi:hypothetical protein
MMLQHSSNGVILSQLLLCLLYALLHCHDTVIHFYFSNFFSNCDSQDYYPIIFHYFEVFVPSWWEIADKNPRPMHRGMTGKCPGYPAMHLSTGERALRRSVNMFSRPNSFLCFTIIVIICNVWVGWSVKGNSSFRFNFFSILRRRGCRTDASRTATHQSILSNIQTWVLSLTI